MRLEIHPDAIKRFNEVGLALSKSCIESKYQTLNHQAATITNKDVDGEITHGMKNSSGIKIGQYFEMNGKLVGLENENYLQFTKLCESITKGIKPQFTVSMVTIENESFKWIRDYFRGNTPTTLIEFILPKIEAQISRLEVWVPIAQLRIESNFRIGKVEFWPISEQLIESWRDNLITSLPPDSKEEKNLSIFFDEKFKKIMQGWTASTIKVEAEPNAAEQLAIFETKRSLSALRLFSDAALNPDVNCYASILGQENIESITTFMFKNDLFLNYQLMSVDNSQRPLYMTDAFVKELRKLGCLDILSDMLKSRSLSSFQESILDSVALYSEATRAKEYSNKLIYILSALEGILLKDENEPIQQNLGDRMANLVGNNLDEKKGIIRNLKAIYGLRSAFLHHAHNIDNSKEFSAFMLNAHRAITNAIYNHDKFSQKQEFVSAIDDKKFS